MLRYIEKGTDECIRAGVKWYRYRSIEVPHGIGIKLLKCIKISTHYWMVHFLRYSTILITFQMYASDNSMVSDSVAAAKFRPSVGAATAGAATYEATLGNDCGAGRLPEGASVRRSWRLRSRIFFAQRCKTIILLQSFTLPVQ